MFVRIIDSNGFFIEDSFVDELTEFTIEKATTISSLRNAMLNYIEVSGVN